MRYKTLALAQVLFVFTILLIVIAMSGIPLSELRKVVLSLVFLQFSIVMILSEILRSIRLKAVIKMISPSNDISLLSCLYSRFVANMVGLFTPSSIGSVPAQTAVLSARNPLPIEVYAGAGLLISMVDAGAAALINLISIFAIERLSLTALVSSIGVLFAWIAGVYLFIFNEPFFKKVLSKLYKRSTRLAKKVDLVEYRASIFREGVRLAIMNARASILSLFISVASFYIIGLAFCLVSGYLYPKTLWTLYIGANTQVLGFLPTPGGSGFYEIGLAEVLGLIGAVKARTALIFFHSIMGLSSMIIVTRNPREVVSRLKQSLTAGIV